MKRESGFSLLEVMIAIAILAISFLALFHLQSTSLLGATRAQRIETATQLAREKMAKSLIELEAGMAKGEFPDQKEDSGTFEEEKYPNYAWKVTVKKVEIPTPPVPEGGADIMAQVFSMISEQLSESSREVKLVVSWKDDEDTEDLITLTTHVVKM